MTREPNLSDNHYTTMDKCLSSVSMKNTLIYTPYKQILSHQNVTCWCHSCRISWKLYEKKHWFGT